MFNPRYQTVLEILGVMLRPALRFCLRNSLGLNEIVEVVKSTFVKLAAEEVQAREEKVTVSRISVMTGVHRPDVKRVLQGGWVQSHPLSLAKRVIGLWEQDSKFTTKGGKPRVLTFGAENSDFSELVKCVSTDINPASMLAELERVGSIRRTKSGLVLANVVEYLTHTPDKAVSFLARDTESLIASAEQNLFDPQEIKNLYLMTEYNNIFRADIPEIKRWIIERGTRFHKEIRDYLSRFDKDLNPQPMKEGGMRVHVGAFSMTTEDREI